MATRRVVRETGLRCGLPGPGRTRRHGPGSDYESAALTAELPAPNPMLEPNRAVPGGQRSAKTSPRRAPVPASVRHAAAGRSSKTLSRNIRRARTQEGASRYVWCVGLFTNLLLGNGTLKPKLRAALESEGVVLVEEGLPGTIRYANFKAPGRRYKGKVTGECFGLGISEQRLALYCRSGRVKLIDQPFTEPRLSAIDVSLDGEDRVALLHRLRPRRGSQGLGSDDDHAQ